MINYEDTEMCEVCQVQFDVACGETNEHDEFICEDCTTQEALKQAKGE